MDLPFKTSAVDPAAPVGEHLLTEMPAPLLFNPWKHHACFLRRQVEQAAAAGEPGLEELAAQLLVLGDGLMDLYLGALTSVEIAAELLGQLQQTNLLALEPYKDWIVVGGGYQQLPLSDGSAWVLRFGVHGERYVHVHPGRWVPKTRRVRTGTLRTALLVLAHVTAQGGAPHDLALVNHVRQRYLDMSPMGEINAGEGLAAVLDDLRQAGA